MRKEGDSNPRYVFDVYTLSRRASSTTRASFPESAGNLSGCKLQLFLQCNTLFHGKSSFFFRIGKHLLKNHWHIRKKTTIIRFFNNRQQLTEQKHEKGNRHL